MGNDFIILLRLYNSNNQNTNAFGMICLTKYSTNFSLQIKHINDIYVMPSKVRFQ